MNKDELRSAAFKSPPVKRIPFEYNGTKFELVSPTVAERRTILQKPNKDNPSMLDIQIWVAIMCTVVPGTTTKVFEETDVASFENMTMEGFLDECSPYCLELINATKTPKED